MKTKRVIALMLAVLACISALSVSAIWTGQVATEERASLTAGQIALFWVNTSSVSCTLNFSGNKAACSAIVSGMSGTTKITGTLTLYRQSGSSWVYVDSWSGSSDSSVLRFSESAMVSSGYNYKVVVNASVYRNGTWETVEKESAVKYCG